MSIIVKPGKTKNNDLEKLLSGRVKNESSITSLDEFITYHGLDYWYNPMILAHKKICEYLYSFHTLTFDKQLTQSEINQLNKIDVDRIISSGLLIVLGQNYKKLSDARDRIIKDFKKVDKSIDKQIFKKACITKKYDVVQIYLDIYGKQKNFIDETIDVIEDVKLLNDRQMLRLLEKYYINK
jgi:hypothetical protein